MQTHGWVQVTRAGMIASLLLGVATAAGQGLDPQVDAILTRLENRAVQDLRAKVEWTLFYPIDETRTVKHGSVWYKDVEPVPMFKAAFDRKVVENRKLKLDEAHLFDGQWYTLIDDNRRMLTRREIRRPGDQYNPYRLGEGAFPLPFGQRKDDMLREFEVALATPDPLVADQPAPEGCDHIRLTPRATSPLRDEYKYVDLWVARTGPLGGLTRQLRAAQLKGTGDVNDYLTIAFDDIELNAGFSESVFSVKKPLGYAEEVIPIDPAQK